MTLILTINYLVAGETSFSYDDTHLCLTGEDERDSTTTNIQHSPDGNDNGKNRV